MINDEGILQIVFFGPLINHGTIEQQRPGVGHLLYHANWNKKIRRGIGRIAR
jgi:hypothetical protein